MKHGPDELDSQRKRKVQKLDQNSPLFGASSDEQRFLNAAEVGDIQTFDELLGRVDINCTGICDETALMLAISNAPKESKSYIIKCLLNRGADTSMINVFGETARSIAKKLDDYETINLLKVANISHLWLPEELWGEIASYLGPEDLDNLRLICHAFNDIYERNSDRLWQPLLNRLHAIDSTVSVSPKLGKTIRETFIAGFININERQSYEIKIVSEKHAQTLQELQIHFDDVHPITLDILELRNEQLDDINCAIIQKVINMNPGNQLELVRSYLTRFPNKILLGANRDYFNQIEIINLSQNCIRFIPDNINLCQNLKEFHCCENFVYELPESICDIKTLTNLCCHDNELIELPNRLDEMVNLESLTCDANHITHLPKDIGNLSQLTNLNIGANHIQVLPESMIKILQNLIDYDFSYNPFLDAENTPGWNFNNAHFISFIDAQKSPPDVSKTTTNVDNNHEIWLPLLDELEKIDPNMKFLARNNESLRDQFIEGFQQLAKNQLESIISLAKTESRMLKKYRVVRNTSTGELGFKNLTLDQLVENENELKIDAQHVYNLRLSDTTTESRALLFQYNSTIHNLLTDLQTEAMDIDEVPKLKQPSW